ncbi:spore coat protein U domain-containing protein [Deefgea piscis]|uniref:Spore coat protein U domain-containing protein n=1 Tax=Deefgea piscis TaxID=2739061 RepID=A0A6M8SXS5_9NEIS|nr:spore coat protein U domain-containing protein [Deefgea piscis]QKJ66517.1 spore coat protein U domain-containing protein [Deefgea piscis]
MNKKLTQSLAIALALLSSASFAEKKNVIINANVVGTCAFADANPITIDFDSLQAGTAPTDKTGIAKFWCSNGTSYTLTANNGSNTTDTQKYLISGVNKIPYSLVLDNKATGTGAGVGTPINVVLTASITEAALDDAPVANNYTDTVTLTLNP